MNPSKMESKFGCQGARGYIVRAAEGGKEVIQRRLVGYVDGGKRKTPFVSIAFE